MNKLKVDDFRTKVIEMIKNGHLETALDLMLDFFCESNFINWKLTLIQKYKFVKHNDGHLRGIINDIEFHTAQTQIINVILDILYPT